MKHSVTIVVFGLLLVGFLAGCSTVPKGEEVEVTYIGSITASSEGFQMEGYLSTGGGVPERETFRDVKIQMYEENGNLLCGVEIGDLTANHGRRNVSVATNVAPEYVLITSPDFWNESVEVNYFQRNPDGESYNREDVTSESDLPVPVADSNRVSCSVDTP